MPRTQKLTDGDDRSVPTEYVGKLDPNYYCRAWNPRRQKYCRQRAGQKTEHVGEGRCNVHGGNAPIVHGSNRRYANISTLRVRELIAEHADAPDPLSLLPELAAARALLQDFIERTAEDEHPGALAAAVGLIAKIAGIVDSIERAKSQNALTIKELELLMLNMGLVVRQNIADDAVCKRIQDGWLALRT